MTTSFHITRRAALIAGAGAVLVAPRIAQAADALTVRCDFAPWGIQAALHLAEVNGWFREANLTVDVQDGRGSGNTLQLVNAGQVDVGQIAVGLLPQARDKGATVRAITCFGRRTDLAVMVDKDGPLHKPADFRGKTLVCFAASPWAPYIDAWLAAGGLDRSTVNLQLIDPGAIWGTYAAHRADGLMSTLPSALPSVTRTRPSRGVLAEEAGITFPSYGLVVTDATLGSKREALKRLVATQQRAWAQIKTKVQDGVDAMLKQRPDARLDPAVQREQIELTLEFFETPATRGRPIGWMAAEDWTAALHSLEAAQSVQPGWDIKNYYTNDLITGA